MVTQCMEGFDPSKDISLDNNKKLEASPSTTVKDYSTQEGVQTLTEEREYLGGVKLILVLTSATLASFLVLLDMVIVATV